MQVFDSVHFFGFAFLFFALFWVLEIVFFDLYTRRLGGASQEFEDIKTHLFHFAIHLVCNLVH